MNPPLTPSSDSGDPYELSEWLPLLILLLLLFFVEAEGGVRDDSLLFRVRDGAGEGAGSNTFRCRGDFSSLSSLICAEGRDNDPDAECKPPFIRVVDDMGDTEFEALCDARDSGRTSGRGPRGARTLPVALVVLVSCGISPPSFRGFSSDPSRDGGLLFVLTRCLSFKSGEDRARRLFRGLPFPFSGVAGALSPFELVLLRLEGLGLDPCLLLLLGLVVDADAADAPFSDTFWVCLRDDAPFAFEGPAEEEEGPGAASDGFSDDDARDADPMERLWIGWCREGEGEKAPATFLAFSSLPTMNPSSSAPWTLVGELAPPFGTARAPAGRSRRTRSRSVVEMVRLRLRSYPLDPKKAMRPRPTARWPLNKV